MFERFTDNARQIIADAQYVSTEMGHDYVGTEHILLAILRDTSGEATIMLDACGVKLAAVLALLNDHFAGVPVRANLPMYKPFSLRAKRMIETSLRESLRTATEDVVIDTRHILLGMLRDPESVGSKVLVSLGVTYEMVLSEYQHPPKEITTGNGGVRILVRRDTVTITINTKAIVSIDGDAVEGAEYTLEAEDEHVVTIKVAE